MKQIILLFILCITYNAQAQSDQKQSAATVQFVNEAKSNVLAPRDAKFVYTQINNQEYVNAFVKVEEALDLNAIEAMGVLVGTKAGNIWTVKIPVEQVEAMTQLDKGIVHIQLDQPLHANMDKAREKTNVDQVHEGMGLIAPFTGKDVVVGILDVGFDYTHPTFYDENGVNYRIKKVWEQKSIGTPPTGYNYGHEIVDSLAILTQQTDNAGQSHGSHVAGIAAGSGYGGTGDKYKGVAYESDLVMVGITPAQDQWTNTGMTDIVDGINYIYAYAESQGKSAVANLSWGCSIGPHDGTSLFSQAVNNLTGEGKIFTVSAGNNGDADIHLNKQFTDTDTLLQSFVDFNTNVTELKTWIDVWGEVGEEFCIKFGTYSGTTLNTTTDFICLDNTNTLTHLIGSDGDTLFLNITALDADINGKPHALLDIHSQTNDKVSLTVKGTNGEVNVWMGYVLESRGIYGDFVSNNVPGAVDGDSQMTIGEMACTESAITVGAYASKVSFTNIAGSNLSYSGYVSTNRICPFSSKGPTTDGRQKPDITAPGMTIASAVNSADPNFSPGGGNANLLVYEYTDLNTSEKYYYGESSGTSMSAPMTAGIVALLLEANPTLTPQEIITLMSNTAILDPYTTDTPDATIWGFGKIDAYAMMLNITSGIEDYILHQKALFPNPTADLLNLDWDGSKSISITNIVGEQYLNMETNDRVISLKSLESGIYVVTVFDKAGVMVASQKIVKL